MEIGLTPCSPRPAGELPACAATAVMEGGSRVGPQQGMDISKPNTTLHAVHSTGYDANLWTPCSLIPAIQTSDTPTLHFDSPAANVRLLRIISSVGAHSAGGCVCLVLRPEQGAHQGGVGVAA